MSQFKDHRANYHTHTYLCRHAGGEAIDYAKEAVRHQFKSLGMTDHAPFKMLADSGSQRMSLDEFYHDYLNQLIEASRYGLAHGLTIYKGLEIEYYDNYNSYYETLLKDLDYMILGQHYLLKNDKIISTYSLKTLDDIIHYRDELIKGLKTGYFSILCHPEICFWSIKNPTDEMYEALRPVIKECVKLNIPIEINGNGIRRVLLEQGKDPRNYDNYRYPKTKFWEMVREEGGMGIVTSDAHSPKLLNDFAIEIAYQFAHDLKIKVTMELTFQFNPFNKKDDL